MAANAYGSSKDDLNFELAQKANSNKETQNGLKKHSVRFTISQNNKPLGGLRPKVWLSLRRSEQVAAETGCEAKIKGFLSGQLATRADADLNSYYLITLNQDKTVTFIDPQVAWSGGKLQGIVQLPEQGLDWAMSKDGKWLYVTMPDADAVALIDTSAHALVRTISTGKGSRPARLAFSPDENNVWVGLDGLAEAAVIDRSGNSTVRRVSAGNGFHQIAFTPDGKLVLITNTKANTVSVIDTSTLAKLSDIAVGNTPLKPVWMPKAERFYVPSINDPAMSVIDPFSRKVETGIEVGRGVVEAAPIRKGAIFGW